MKKYSMLAFVIMVMALFLVAGCGNSNVATEENASEVLCGEILFTGSSTLAPAITQLTKDFADKNKTWDQVEAKLPQEEIKLFVTSGGSGDGVKSVIDGSSNFGMVSRPVSEEEQASIEGYQEYKLGTDALTISVNPENEIYKVKDSLSTEELQKVFSGEYKFWNDLDGSLPQEEIVLVTRDLGGGAHKVFVEKVMGDIEVSENVIQAPSMGALVAKIMENKNAIGYASYGVVNQNEGKLIPLKADGVEPTKENILSGDYSISRPLLVISNGDINDYEKILIDYITSEEGMKVIAELGFVPEK